MPEEWNLTDLSETGDIIVIDDIDDPDFWGDDDLFSDIDGLDLSDDGIEYVSTEAIEDVPFEEDEPRDVAYFQGNNDLGYQGTCGPTSQANALNLLFDTNEFSENELLHVAVNNDLCNTSGSAAECGGMTTQNLMNLYGIMSAETGGAFTAELFDYDEALSAEQVAQRLEQGDVINVAVDSDVLWGNSSSGFDPLGVRRPTESPSDHWITVSGVQRDAGGSVCGFDIVDSGGGVSTVDLDTYNAMCFGNGSHTVSDPTCIVVSKNR